jgi:hypothetical protein
MAKLHWLKTTRLVYEGLLSFTDYLVNISRHNSGVDNICTALDAIRRCWDDGERRN